MLTPYYDDGRGIVIHHGNAMEIAPALGGFDIVLTDPPYGETSLSWDHWPSGWPEIAAERSAQLWCFGSMRMFLAKIPEFSAWKFCQDIVWEKHNGSGLLTDRFRRVHEHACHFTQGAWSEHYKCPQFTMDAKAIKATRRTNPQHYGGVGNSKFTSEENGPRLQRSVIRCRSEHGSAINETQKPEGIVRALLEYSCPPGGIVLDMFSGSGTTLVAAKASGRRAIGIEMREEQCEGAARRLQQEVLAL